MKTPIFDRAGMHPQLRSHRDELVATLVRAFAYVGGIAVLAVILAGFFETPRGTAAVEPQPPRVWVDIGNNYPAFALVLPELGDPEPQYAILRHVQGEGRKDVMAWGAREATGSRFMLEVYRPGREFRRLGEPLGEIAARVGGLGIAERLRPAETLDSKFGPVALVSFAAKADQRTRHCLGFVRGFDQPLLQIAGWYCRPGAEVVDRATVACALDRLTLLMAASDPKVSELFARAELKRNFCKLKTSASPAVRRNDWIDGTRSPKLRRSVAER
jgi:hypothetical protein